MPLEHYPQPAYALLDDEELLWRYMKVRTFERFIVNGELYFSRADQFDDDAYEGLPPEQYVRDVAARMGPGTSFEHSWGELKNNRQGSFVSCWSSHKSIYMWEKFAREGVAVQTNVGLLKAALDAVPARTMIGRIRYSNVPAGYNILRFVTTKRLQYAPEKEVRAMAWDMTLSPSNPYQHESPKGLVFRANIAALAQQVIISPHAPTDLLEKVQTLLATHGYDQIPVVRSKFTGFSHLLPTKDDIDKLMVEELKRLSAAK